VEWVKRVTGLTIWVTDTNEACCTFDDPPLPGSEHAPAWERRWGMSIQERLAGDDPDLDEQLRRVFDNET
jgi:hypothetical protein